MTNELSSVEAKEISRRAVITVVMSRENIPSHCDRPMSRNGKRNNRQQWRCSVCGHQFREGVGVPGQPRKGVTLRLTLEEVEALRSGIVPDSVRDKIQASLNRSIAAS